DLRTDRPVAKRTVVSVGHLRLTLQRVRLSPQAAMSSSDAMSRRHHGRRSARRRRDAARSRGERRVMPSLLRLLARRRVTLGFVFAVAVIYFASPTRQSLVVGTAI